MEFITFLFYLISSGIFLAFLGKKFDWRRGVNRHDRVVGDIVFKLQLVALALVDVDKDLYLVHLSLPYLIVMLFYLNIYKEGTLIEKIYWVTLIKCISSCAMLISLVLLQQLPLERLPYYIGNATYVLIVALLLVAEYISLFCVTRVSPKLEYLGSKALILFTVVNVIWMAVFRILEAMEHLKFLLLGASLLLFSYIVYFVIMNLLSKNVEKLASVQSEYENMQLKTKYYEEVELINKEVRKYRHDLSNHLNMLYYFIDTNSVEEAKQYLDSMEQNFNQINKIFYFIDTGNKAVDFILNSKLLVAREKGIEVKSSVGMMPNLYVNDMDLCTLLANLLDNSIEACQLFQKENPFIKINIQLIKKNFMINIKNSSNPVQTDEEGNYLTNKKTGDHGFGMLQINRIIKQYNGFISRKYADDVFETDIVLFKPVE